MAGWQGRGTLVARQWRLLILLRRGRWTLPALARELEVCARTVQRDLAALSDVPFPIVKTGTARWNARWTLDAMPEWPRNERTPVRELRAQS